MSPIMLAPLVLETTLEDTIRTIEMYSDIIMMRHFESGDNKRAVITANIHVINARNGPDQHPTQFWGKNDYTNARFDEVSED
ncbi:hypothetical protein L2E82_22827 [Cichorium intybus]|uniref:Uncharacterized protein n=1 Tax=Cichorium intybus TaxID=13427 RepID=A0ACB9DZV4_CICIN|nr:hypothetical protein L2E82_22827 [Cichorium intybus]